jgi:hypothetical protein
MSYTVVIDPTLYKRIQDWSANDQIALYGGLISPLQQFGFEFIVATLLSPTTVLSVEWIEPLENPPAWAFVHVNVGNGVVRLRVDGDAPMRISPG